MTYVFGVLAARTMLLQAAEKGGEASASGMGAWGMYVLIAVMVAVFYFLLIRPQRKRAKEHEKLVTELRKGDEVVTIGGIHGVVKKTTGDTVVIEVDKGVRITLLRSAISKSITEHEEEEEEEEEPEEGYEEEEEYEETEEEGEGYEETEEEGEE